MDSTRNTIMIFVDLDRPFLSVFSAAYECAVPEIHDLRTMQELCEGICPKTIYCWIVVALQQVCFSESGGLKRTLFCDGFARALYIHVDDGSARMRLKFFHVYAFLPHVSSEPE